MTRRELCALLVAFVPMAFAGTLIAQHVAQLSGAWDVTISNPNGDPLRERWFMEQRGTKVTGTVRTQRGDEVPVEGTVDGNKVNLTALPKTPNGERRELKVTATVEGDTGQGSMRIGDSDRKWSAKRAGS